MMEVPGRDRGRCLESATHRKDQGALQEALEKGKEEREGGVEQTGDDRERLGQERGRA